MRSKSCYGWLRCARVLERLQVSSSDSACGVSPETPKGQVPQLRLSIDT